MALMFLLLPMLLLTTSASRLVGLDLAVAPDGGALPPSPTGRVERLEVRVQEGGLELRADVRRADVVTSAGEIERRVVRLPPVDGAPDLAGLQAALRPLKALDPDQEQVSVLPDDGVPTRAVVHVMDAVRGDGQGALFPQVALGGADEAAP